MQQNALKYTEKIHKQIVAAIAGGATHRAAARAACVTPETLSHWKKQFPKLGEDIERAEGQARVRLEKILSDLARKGDFRAVKYLLEHRYSQDWGDSAPPQTQDAVCWPGPNSTFRDFVDLGYEFDRRLAERLRDCDKKKNPGIPESELPEIKGGFFKGREAEAAGSELSLESSGL
jgi:transposase-like protein